MVVIVFAIVIAKICCNCNSIVIGKNVIDSRMLSTQRTMSIMLLSTSSDSHTLLKTCAVRRWSQHVDNTGRMTDDGRTDVSIQCISGPQDGPAITVQIMFANIKVSVVTIKK